MDYGFDFTNDICYISTFDGKEIEDLASVSCPSNLEERILFAENYCKEEGDRAVLVIEDMTKEALAYDRPGITFISKEQAFAAYLFEQKQSVWKRETAAFEFHKHSFSYFQFKLQGKSCLVEKEQEAVEELRSEKSKDKFFTKQAADRLNHENIANVFLVGEEFEGEWMKMSLASLCSGRRVFMGNHLFANGAVYSLREDEQEYTVYTHDHHLYYWGIRAFHHGQKDVFVPIIQPGQFWFATEGSVRILADECDVLEIEGVHSVTRQKLSIKLPLHMKQQYPLRTTKLKIQMYCTGTKTLKIIVHDMGFGVSREGKGMIYQEEFKLP